MPFFWESHFTSNNMQVLRLPHLDNKEWLNLFKMSTQQISFAQVLLEADQLTQRGLARWIDAQDEDYKSRLGAQTVLALESASGHTTKKFFKEEFVILCDLLQWFHKFLPKPFSSYQVNILDVFPDWIDMLEEELVTNRLFRTHLDGGISIRFVLHISTLASKEKSLCF